jgi:hypothetical protein
MERKEDESEPFEGVSVHALAVRDYLIRIHRFAIGIEERQILSGLTATPP